MFQDGRGIGKPKSAVWTVHLWIWEISRTLQVRCEPGSFLAESGGRCRTDDANDHHSQRSDNSRHARHQPKRTWDPNLRGTKAVHMLDKLRAATRADQDCTAAAATSGTRLHATAWECDGIDTGTTCSYTINLGAANSTWHINYVESAAEADIYMDKICKPGTASCINHTARYRPQHSVDSIGWRVNLGVQYQRREEIASTYDSVNLEQWGRLAAAPPSKQRARCFAISDEVVSIGIEYVAGRWTSRTSNAQSLAGEIVWRIAALRTWACAVTSIYFIQFLTDIIHFCFFCNTPELASISFNLNTVVTQVWCFLSTEYSVMFLHSIFTTSVQVYKTRTFILHVHLGLLSFH